METVNCTTCKTLVWETEIPSKKSGNCWRCEIDRYKNGIQTITGMTNIPFKLKLLLKQLLKGENIS